MPPEIFHGDQPFAGPQVWGGGFISPEKPPMTQDYAWRKFQAASTLKADGARKARRLVAAGKPAHEPGSESWS
jgi:hypothetical protein